MPRERKLRPEGKIAIDMTPMIDIVFQLLTFFIMTLKIATAEGDFQIRMPASREGHAPTTTPPIHVYLQSDQSGDCASCPRRRGVSPALIAGTGSIANSLAS